MTNTDQGRTPAVQPEDPAMQAGDPAMFAPLTTDENGILGAHLISGWYKQSAVYPTLSEPWKETRRGARRPAQRVGHRLGRVTSERGLTGHRAGTGTRGGAMSAEAEGRPVARRAGRHLPRRRTDGACPVARACSGSAPGTDCP